MLSGNCTEALSIQANVTISGPSTKLIKNGIAPLPFPLPALLMKYWYIKRGERVRVRGHAPFYATLGLRDRRACRKGEEFPGANLFNDSSQLCFGQVHVLRAKVGRIAGKIFGQPAQPFPENGSRRSGLAGLSTKLSN